MTTPAEMIAALPADKRSGAWAAFERQRVDALHRVMASGGPQAVADALSAVAAAEGPEMAERLRTAWQDTGSDWADRQAALGSPQAQGRSHDRLALLAAEGHPWAVSQLDSEGHRQAS